MNADDIQQLLQEIPVHQPTVVPVRAVQPEEAMAAESLLCGRKVTGRQSVVSACTRRCPSCTSARLSPSMINLTPNSIMQQAGVPMLYDSASYLNPHLPCLYICPVANVLGCAPLIPCFIGGNSHPTIPHSFKDHWSLGRASTYTQRDRGIGSRLYEVNIWMWHYGQSPWPPPDSVHCRG